MIVLWLAIISVIDQDTPQDHAEREAQMMADRKQVAHYLGCCEGARFSGVGKSRNPYPKTCYPWEFKNPAREIIADAIIEKDGWFYRSTHWK